MIQDILPRYQETADGIKTEFTPPFDLLDSDYIIVYVNDTRLSTGYSVVSNKIVFTTAPVADSLVTIQRVLPIEWTNENYGSIDKEVFSNILTNLVAQMQTLKEAVDRAVKTEPYDRDDGGSMSEDFIRQMREALDILDEIERLTPSLVALKNEIDTYIEDASDAVVAYINNLTSDDIAEFSQLADQKLAQLQAIISTISIDPTLGGNSASDSVTSSQKAIKSYVDGKDSNLQGQIDVKANDSAVVHLSGTETITGNKMFTDNLIRMNTNITKGTNPSSQTYCTVEFTDKNGSGTKNRVGLLESAIKTNGDIETLIGAYKYENNSTTVEKISVTYPKTGNPYTFAPRPTDTTTSSGTQIATTGWVNSGSNNVVHKSADETIAGTKTFTETTSGANLVQSTSATATGSYVDFVQQINGSRRGTIRTTYNSDGSYSITLGCNGPDAAVPTGVIVKRTSTTTTVTVPTPAVSDNSTKIATTAYVSSKYKKVSTLPASPDSNITYFIPE